MKRTHQHTIDFLFPIALFFVFSSTALVALLLAANIYQGIVIDSESQFQQETSLSYITTKIRQNDEGGIENIYLDQFDGCHALAIEQSFEDVSFITYLYEADGELKELFLQKGVDASAKNGTTILEVENLDMEEIADGLFKFSCTTADGSRDSVIISISSENI